MTRMLHVVGAAVLMVAVAGCVTQEKYNALKLDRDGLAEQLGKAQNDAGAARAEADSYKQQIATIMSQGGSLQGLVTNLQQQNANLQSQLDEMNRRYLEAMSRAGAGTMLPAPLTSELTALANSNPDVMDFDAARGIVKFKSDVTFAKGDATLQPRAKEVITRFASILNSGGASGYELLVAGHTDNTPVVNPATKQAGHKDNWYLSAHRAISVGEELITQRTNPQRIGVVGYADQRPIAPNASEAGKAQNRRVEVLILPTQVRGNYATTPTRQTTPTRSQQPMNKDTGGSANSPTAPVFNK
jgi:chemotaxis protein MotB